MGKIMTEKEKLELRTLGYSIYYRRISEGIHSETTLKLIEKRRKELFTKYSDTNQKEMRYMMGLCYSENFLAPIDYPGVFVDMDDVFAVTYVYDINPGFVKSRNERFILWLFLTNNEYIPVIPAIYLQKTKVYDRITKVKRNDMVPVFTKLCHNLRYPILEMEEFERLLEKEPSVRGKLSRHFIEGQIYDARSLTGLFDPRTISCEMSGLTRDILCVNGYVID